MLANKRVLLVTNIFPPQIGGPATFIDALARDLATSFQCRVRVICSSVNVKERSDSDRPFEVQRISTNSRYRYHLTLRAALVGGLLTHRYVLVNGLEQYVYPIAKLLRRKFVLKVVGDPVWEGARNLGDTALSFDEFQLVSGGDPRWRPEVEARNAYVRYASAIITPSRYLREVAVNWGADSKRVFVVNNAAVGEVDLSGPVKGVARRNSGQLRVLFVGRLTNWKGVETLLLALRGLPGVDATIVGDGPAYPYLTSLARQLNISERVAFTGRQTTQAIREHMAAAHVLVLTSLYEGLSHTILEALSIGLPCVASDCGGNPEVVVDGRNGLLVPPENVPALRQALERLQNNETERYLMGLVARRSAGEYSFQRTVRGVVDLISRTD